jgi:hypothetical protein
LFIYYDVNIKGDGVYIVVIYEFDLQLGVKANKNKNSATNNHDN